MASQGAGNSSVAAKMPIPKKSRTIKTDRPRPFLCSICTRGFARQEHLKRHQRAHTNEKPFLCAFCGRCFARRDLVLRHQQKLHSSLTDTGSGAPPNNGDAKNHLNERHIITISGNKQTMLPMLGSASDPSVAAISIPRQPTKVQESNPNPSRQMTPQVPQNQRQPVLSGQKQQKLSGTSITPHSHGPELEERQQKRKRHASFSASSSITYTQAKDASGIIEHDIPDIPHQVGFSTPQLSAQELVEKALESGFNLEDLPFPPPLELPEAAANPLMSQRHQSDDNLQRLPIHESKRNHSASDVRSALSVDTPLLSDYLQYKVNIS